MQNVIATLTKDIAHYEIKISQYDKDILHGEIALAAARAEREKHIRYIAEVREAIAELSPEGEPARAAA